MASLKLIIPDISMAEEIRAYRRDMLAAGSTLDGCGALKRLGDDPEKWLEFNRLLASPDTCPSQYVDATQLVCFREEDRSIVGMLDIRHRLNAYLSQFGGNIGYSVRPDERRKGYAAWMLREALDLCRTRGMKEVLICCLEGNEGSRRTILRCGGTYERTVRLPIDAGMLEHYRIRL